MTTEEQFWAAVNWLKTVPDPRAKLLASQAALVGDMREALWICVEHNALRFGETHNTVVQGRAALAGAAPAAQGDALDQGVREELSIGKAINRAARDLPEGWEIRIDLERHAGVVFLIDPNGNETMSEGGELFSDQINAAIDAARAAKEGQNND